MVRFGYLSLSLLTIGLITPMSWGSYMTSFEAPTFTAGGSPAKDGWTASGYSPAPVVTSAQHAGTGSQSILIPKNTAKSSGIIRNFSAAESTAADNGLTFDFMPGAGSTAGDPVAWFYVFSDQGYTQFHLQNAASSMTTPRVYWYDSQTKAYSYAYVPNGIWTNEQWNTLQVELDPVHQTLDVSINGTDAFAAPLAAAPTRFSAFWAYEDSNNDLYIDNVSVGPVPEPASLALLGLGGAALLMRRRRR